MTRILTGGALLAALASALLLSGCFEGGANTSCASDCFSLNFKEGTPQAEIDAKIKQACDGMGKTTPQVTERTPTAVAGRCT